MVGAGAVVSGGEVVLGAASVMVGSTVVLVEPADSSLPPHAASANYCDPDAV